VRVGVEAGDNWTRRRRWMGKKVQIGGLEMNGLCQIFGSWDGHERVG